MPRKGSLFRELPILVIVALGVSLVIKTLFVQFFFIPSGSMENTLQINDRVAVNKLPFIGKSIGRGDVVVFRDPVGAAHGAGLDLAAVGGDGEVGDGAVFGLTGAVAEDGGVAVGLGQLHAVEGFGEGTDLVHLDEDRVGGAGIDALLEELGVGDEEIVAHQLYMAADGVGELLPRDPVALGAAVLDRDDRVLRGELAVELDHLVAGEDVAVDDHVHRAAGGLEQALLAQPGAVVEPVDPAADRGQRRCRRSASPGLNRRTTIRALPKATPHWAACFSIRTTLTAQLVR